VYIVCVFRTVTYYSALYCLVLFCVGMCPVLVRLSLVLYWFVSFRVVLCCFVPFCVVSCCFVLFWFVLSWNVLRPAVLFHVCVCVRACPLPGPS
jgi:hypothetical protein